MSKVTYEKKVVYLVFSGATLKLLKINSINKLSKKEQLLIIDSLNHFEFMDFLNEAKNNKATNKKYIVNLTKKKNNVNFEINYIKKDLEEIVAQCIIEKFDYHYPYVNFEKLIFDKEYENKEMFLIKFNNVQKFLMNKSIIFQDLFINLIKYNAKKYFPKVDIFLGKYDELVFVNSFEKVRGQVKKAQKILKRLSFVKINQNKLYFDLKIAIASSFRKENLYEKANHVINNIINTNNKIDIYDYEFIIEKQQKDSLKRKIVNLVKEEVIKFNYYPILNLEDSNEQKFFSMLDANNTLYSYEQIFAIFGNKIEYPFDMNNYLKQQNLDFLIKRKKNNQKLVIDLDLNNLEFFYNFLIKNDIPSYNYPDLHIINFNNLNKQKNHIKVIDLIFKLRDLDIKIYAKQDFLIEEKESNFYNLIDYLIIENSFDKIILINKEKQKAIKRIIELEKNNITKILITNIEKKNEFDFYANLGISLFSGKYIGGISPIIKEIEKIF